jgi:flagellar hook-associated protein 3 FlgL
MIQNISPSADAFLAAVNQLQAKVERAQEEIGSGLRVNKPSDDPSVVSDILQINSSLSRNTQIGQNLGNVTAEVSGAEQALSGAVSTLDNVATLLGSQGANFNRTASDRAEIAAQIQDQLQNLIGDANTSVGNRFVFSGDADQTTPYALDLTTANGTTPYAGSAATRQVEDPRGGAFSVSQSAQQIFDAPGASVFAAVNAIRVALLANDQAGITTGLADLKTAQDSLNSSLSYYGSIQNQVADASAATTTIGLQLASNLSAVRDADAVAVASDLTTAQLQLQAAFSARAKFPSTSLFNFLA